jgi:hypothetical protein
LLTADQGTNSATVIDFKDSADKSLRTLLLGKKHMRKSGRAAPQFGDMGGGDEGYPDGRYVKLASDQNVCIISEPLANIEPKPEQWLNKDFFKVEKIRAIAVTFPVETNSWKLSRETETGEWKLADAKPGEQLDAGKTSSLNSALSSPSFNDVATGTKPEQLGLDKPTLVSLETFDNFTYSFKLGPKTNDNVPLTLNVAAQLSKERVPAKDEKPEDKARLDQEFQVKQKQLRDKLEKEQKLQDRPYLMAKGAIEQLLKDRGTLMKAPSPSPSPAAATSPAKPPATPIKPAPSANPKKRP